MKNGSLTLKSLTLADLAAVQEVLEAAPTYHILLTGKTADEHTAYETLTELPPGKTAADKFSLGVFQDSTMIGMIDLIRGYPDANRAMLGLLVLKESSQGMGLGKRSYELIEDFIRDWGAQKVRIGVTAVNAPGMAFWEKIGFKRTGEVKPYTSGSVVSKNIVLEKDLSVGHLICP